jgi:hypothetical protein
LLTYLTRSLTRPYTGAVAQRRNSIKELRSCSKVRKFGVRFEVLSNAKSSRLSRAKGSSIDPESHRFCSVNDDRCSLSPSTASHDMPPSAQDVRAKFTRFRILVVGRANVSKTTLLQKVCNATGKPEIFDGKGNKVDHTFHATSALPTDKSRSDQCRCRETLRRCTMYVRPIGTFLPNS